MGDSWKIIPVVGILFLGAIGLQQNAYAETRSSTKIYYDFKREKPVSAKKIGPFPMHFSLSQA